MKKNLIILIIIFVASCNFAMAQFSQNTSVNKIETKKVDTITVDVAPKLDMAVYNSAYDKYLRSVQFKKRNKIEIKNTGVTLTQTAFDNWASGGSNSFTTRAAANIKHIYTYYKFDLESIFDGAYGTVLTDGVINKNEDWFNISITPNYVLSPHWKLTGSIILKSQFSHSFSGTGEDKTLSSSFLSPGQLYVTAGVTYNSKIKDKFSIFVAPLSGNLLMVINDDLALEKKFGMDEVGRKFKPSFGVFSRIIFNANLHKDMITYSTKLETFWNYNLAPTFWWENKINFKFTNLFSANLYIQMRYDEEMETPRSLEGKNSFWDKWQINESFGLGLVYNFKSKAPQEEDVSKFVKARDTKKRRR